MSHQSVGGINVYKYFTFIELLTIADPVKSAINDSARSIIDTVYAAAVWRPTIWPDVTLSACALIWPDWVVTCSPVFTICTDILSTAFINVNFTVDTWRIKTKKYVNSLIKNPYYVKVKSMQKRKNTMYYHHHRKFQALTIISQIFLYPFSFSKVIK